jgi:hypothetical protein
MGIALWILFFPAYLHLYSLDEADFFSPNQIWENPDSEVMLADFEKKGKILGATVSPVAFFLCIILCKSLSCFSFQTPSLCKQAIVLRC